MVSLLTDGFNKNGVENLFAFNHASPKIFEEYKALGCSLIDPLVKDRPIFNKPECEKYLAYIAERMSYLDFSDIMRSPVLGPVQTQEAFDIEAYFNQAEVRQALHVPDFVQPYKIRSPLIGQRY